MYEAVLLQCMHMEVGTRYDVLYNFMVNNFRKLVFAIDKIYLIYKVS